MSTRFDRPIAAALLGAALTFHAQAATADPPAGTAASASSPAGVVASVLPGDPTPDPWSDEDFEIGSEPSVSDPWEPANRVFFGFNQVLDTVLWDPITSGYQFLVPAPGRRSIRRFFLNLNSPVVFVNDLLQLRFKDAAETMGRFVLNTAVGAGGLFDAGKEAGWEAHHADFGQTLALVGVKSGPYLVVPLFGPSTVRDGVGDLVDSFLQPLNYVLGTAPQLLIGTGRGLSTREKHDAEIEALEASSVDFYAAMRSAYLQHREAQIRARRRPQSVAEVDAETDRAP